MLPLWTHLTFEIAGVALGIVLTITGTYLVRQKRRKLKTIGVLNLIGGIGSIIVDGFIFLPSWFF